jgi:hypothetical protein
MIQQVEITLSPKSRGFHLVTSEVMRQLPKLPMYTRGRFRCVHLQKPLRANNFLHRHHRGGDFFCLFSWKFQLYFLSLPTRT